MAGSTQPESSDGVYFDGPSWQINPFELMGIHPIVFWLLSPSAFETHVKQLLPVHLGEDGPNTTDDRRGLTRDYKVPRPDHITRVVGDMTLAELVSLAPIWEYGTKLTWNPFAVPGSDEARAPPSKIAIPFSYIKDEIKEKYRETTGRHILGLNDKDLGPLAVPRSGVPRLKREDRYFNDYDREAAGFRAYGESALPLGIYVGLWNDPMMKRTVDLPPAVFAYTDLSGLRGQSIFYYISRINPKGRIVSRKLSNSCIEPFDCTFGAIDFIAPFNRMEVAERKKEIHLRYSRRHIPSLEGFVVV